MKNEYPLSVCAGEIDVSHTMERGFSGKGQDLWVLKLLSKLVYLRGIRGMPIKECHVVDTHIQVRKISNLKVCPMSFSHFFTIAIWMLSSLILPLHVYGKIRPFYNRTTRIGKYSEGAHKSPVSKENTAFFSYFAHT